MKYKKQSRMTKQRRLILEEVRKVKTHPTAHEVYEMVRKRLPRISMGTVYRNLDVLSASGEITKLKTSGSEYRFDANTNNHYHVRCVHCGRVDDIERVSIHVPEAQVQASVDYDIIGHRLEFIGICRECKAGLRSSVENHRETLNA